MQSRRPVGQYAPCRLSAPRITSPANCNNQWLVQASDNNMMSLIHNSGCTAASSAAAAPALSPTEPKRSLASLRANKPINTTSTAGERRNSAFKSPCRGRATKRQRGGAGREADHPPTQPKHRSPNTQCRFEPVSVGNQVGLRMVIPRITGERVAVARRHGAGWPVVKDEPQPEQPGAQPNSHNGSNTSGGQNHARYVSDEAPTT